MKKHRSQSGCLTCRARRVKCDEIGPICGQCSKKDRSCIWKSLRTSSDSTQQGDTPSPSVVAYNNDAEKLATTQKVRGAALLSQTPSTETGSKISSEVSSDVSAASSLQPSLLEIKDATSIDSFVHQTDLEDASYSQIPSALAHDEALLVHHYTKYLSRWLDCTDGSRQFALSIPGEVTHCSILRYAVLCFAARHRSDNSTATVAYQHSVALLIHRLNEVPVNHNDTLLCAIVILNFCDHLHVPLSSVPDARHHLSGCAAVLRSSQGDRFVDPSAPTLREAAFWVYVRQCLYNGTIRQEPLDIDFSLELRPLPAHIVDSHPLTRLHIETAWANQATWNTACVANFCFGGTQIYGQQSGKIEQWQHLWNANKTWQDQKPTRFDPIWSDTSGSTSIFANIWFIADCHVLAYGFYHLSCLLLLMYKPGSKFVLRSVGSSLSVTETRILEHARAICRVCKSSLESVPICILLCHTVFMWGPLLHDAKERSEVIVLLTEFAKVHRWSTAWIVEALTKEWGIT